VHADRVLVNEPGRSPIPALLRPASAHCAEPVRQTILVPVDGLELSQSAIEYVIALARSVELTVHLLNVQEPVTAADVTLFTSARTVELERRTAGERALRDAKRALMANGIRYVVEVAFGSPVDEIIRCATTSGCSKIVMATRGKGLLRSFIGRAIAHHVARMAPVPVTLIKPHASSSASASPARRRVPPTPSAVGKDCVHGGNASVPLRGLIGSGRMTQYVGAFIGGLHEWLWTVLFGSPRRTTTA
jgi:nucleotide-binding universal stress UspA family protein